MRGWWTDSKEEAKGKSHSNPNPTWIRDQGNRSQKPYHMYGSAIPRVMSKHPGPQLPPLEISHCGCLLLATRGGCRGELHAEESVARAARGAHWIGTSRESLELRCNLDCIYGRTQGVCLEFACSEKTNPLKWFLPFLSQISNERSIN